MNIVLLNHAHNGDVLLTLEIVKNILKSNPEHKYQIRLSCSFLLYQQFLSENVQITHSEAIWLFDSHRIISDWEFSDIKDELWFYRNDILYINLWRVLTQDNECSININRIKFIKDMFENIKNETNIELKFDVINYLELIPILPEINIDNLSQFIKTYNKPTIFLYNLFSRSVEFNEGNFDFNKFIIHLLAKYENHLIVVPRNCDIQHENLISLERDLKIMPNIDGSTLVLYAAIANTCDIVFLAPTGGSMFCLNKRNISNKNVKYYSITDDIYLNAYKECFLLDCEYYTYN
jgi:hypothetical protein